MAVRARVCPDGPRSVSPGILPAGPPAATLILHRRWSWVGAAPAEGRRARHRPAGLGEELEEALFGRGGGGGGRSCCPGPRPQFSVCCSNRSCSRPCSRPCSP
ncbi:unnamed protein product [Coccothraustes coccothraustes]